MPDIRYCPGTLAEGHTSYSRTCLKHVFDGKQVSHILPHNSSQRSEEDALLFMDNRKRISISGVQEKMSLILDKNKLRLTKENEQGTHILKPIPRDLKKVNQVPANEHLTMQIASRVYGIQTAANALIFFRNGEPAYITRRFDVKKDGGRWGVEDFASLAQKTSENAGPDFKYNYCYEEVAQLLVQYVPAHKVEMEKLFQLILFNYLFSNGDAHLKNFSLMETPTGDYILSPAYDLINTRIHVHDTDFALSDGLFKDDFESARKKLSGRVGRVDFYEWARRMHISEKRRDKLAGPLLKKQDQVVSLIKRSYLDEQTKRAYLIHYQTKRNQLIKS